MLRKIFDGAQRVGKRYGVEKYFYNVQRVGKKTRFRVFHNVKNTFSIVSQVEKSTVSVSHWKSKKWSTLQSSQK